MCYGLPAKSIDQAKQRLTPEQWARFEREYDDFCVIHGMPRNPGWSIFLWAKLAFFQGRQHREVHHAQAPCSCRCDKFPGCGCGRQINEAKYTRLAIAMMSDEQAQMSLERWEEKTR